MMDEWTGEKKRIHHHQVSTDIGKEREREEHSGSPKVAAAAAVTLWLASLDIGGQ